MSSYSRELDPNLKRRYRTLLYACTMCGVLLPLALWMPVALKMGEAMGLTEGVPVRTHPNGTIALTVGLLSFIGCLALGCFAVLKLITVGIAITNGWTWERAKRAVSEENQYPRHWYTQNPDAGLGNEKEDTEPNEAKSPWQALWDLVRPKKRTSIETEMAQLRSIRQNKLPKWLALIMFIMCTGNALFCGRHANELIRLVNMDEVNANVALLIKGMAWGGLSLFCLLIGMLLASLSRTSHCDTLLLKVYERLQRYDHEEKD